MSVTRRRFCVSVAGAGMSLPLMNAGQAADSRQKSAARQVADPFRHGVASGDPLADRVILWTRITPDTDAAVDVEWVIAADPGLEDIVTSGRLTTDANRDYTVKAEPAGLAAGTTYYYRFSALGHDSVTGRTKTLPVGGVDRLRIAVASCSNYPFGFFNAYALIARRADLDAVLHLGDYLYEYANGVYGDGTPLDRASKPDREIVSLLDYRERHAQYKSDPDLQEAHRQHPFITVWDDHESTNNSWENGAENHNPEEGEGDWQTRKDRSVRAYHEWMPIREVQQARQEVIYRSFKFGDLVDLVMLDTRLIARDEQAPSPEDLGIINDASRTLLGKTQESWFIDELSRSQREATRWRVVGQQVMFGQLSPAATDDPQASGPGSIINTDQWDGYAPARQRVFDHIRDNAIDNVVLLTGDIHSSWALDLTPEPFNAGKYNANTGEGSLAVEFITPAITSPGAATAETAEQEERSILSGSPHIKYVDRFRRGYLLLDIDHARAQAEWYHIDTVTERSRNESFAKAFKTMSGSNRIEEVASPASARANEPVLAALTANHQLAKTG